MSKITSRWFFFRYELNRIAQPYWVGFSVLSFTLLNKMLWIEFTDF